MSTNEGQRDTCLGSEIKSHLLKGLQRRKYPQKKVRFQLEYVETAFTHNVGMMRLILMGDT